MENNSGEKIGDWSATNLGWREERKNDQAVTGDRDGRLRAAAELESGGTLEVACCFASDTYGMFFPSVAVLLGSYFFTLQPWISSSLF